MSGGYGVLGDLFMDLGDVSEEVRHLLRRYLEGNGCTLGWGASRGGELGAGSRTNLITPIPLHGRDKILRVGCSAMSSVQIGAHGAIFTMGSGAFGELGVGNLRKSPLITFNENGKPIALVQIRLPTFSPENMFLDVQGGHAFFAAISVKGDLFLWGLNNYSQCLGVTEEKRCACPERRIIPGEKVVEVGCSNFTVLALTDSGSVYGWGHPGLLGGGTSHSMETPCDSIVTVDNGKDAQAVVLGPIRMTALEKKSIVSLRVGPWHAVAIGADGKAYSWGIGKDGRLGHGNEDNVMSPKHLTTFQSKVIEASCGSFHTCFVTKDGSAFACGNNEGGQCGVVGAVMVTTCHRISIPSHRNVISVFCGRHHTLLLLESGEVMAYGTGLGVGSGLGSSMRLVRGANIMDNYTTFYIRSGTCHNFSFALPKNMVLMVLGVPHRGVTAAVDAIPLKEGVLCAALGNGFSIVVSRCGCCCAFGVGGWGQLGMDVGNVHDRTPDESPVVRHPVRIPYFARTLITHVSAGVSFALALTEGQRVFAWGSNLYGQCGLGVNPKEHTSVPEPLEILWLADKLIVQVACGCYFALALGALGEVYSWGIVECCGHDLEPSPTVVPKNLLLESLGSESRASILLPVKIPGLSGIISVAAGAWHAVALNAIGEIFTWGFGSSGRLGLGSEDDYYIPTKINLRVFIARLGCGTFSSYAISDDGDLYVWGSNGKNNLSPVEGDLLQPTKVLNDVKEVAIGKHYMLALTRDDGIRFSGTLQHGTNTYVSRSLHDTDALPPMLTRKSMTLEGFRAVRVFGGVEHAIVLVEKDAIPPATVTSLYKAFRDQPKRIIKSSQGRFPGN